MSENHIKSMLSNFINGNKETAAIDLHNLLVDKLRVTEAAAPSKRIKRFWTAVFNAMFSSTTMGLTVEDVKAKDEDSLEGDYVVKISASMVAAGENDRISAGEIDPGDEEWNQEDGTITKKGNKIKMKIGNFDEDITHIVGLGSARQTGENLSHALDDALF